MREVYPNKTLLGDHIKPADVVQGDLGDCYYLATISACAQHPEIISNAIISQDYVESGAIALKVLVRGVETTVIIDDFIPVHEGLPSFTSPNEDSGLWPMILERVWAKVNGNYENIIAGSGTEAIRFLTGAPSYTFSWGVQNEDEDN